MKIRRMLAMLGVTTMLFTSFATSASAANAASDKTGQDQPAQVKEKSKKGDPREGDWRYDPSVQAPGSGGSLTSTTAPDGLTTLGLQFSPAGCNGQTDWPHLGGYGWQEASVHGRTKCSVPVYYVGVTTTLQKQGWLWWDNMQTGSSSMVNSNNSQDATPHWNCVSAGSQNYRGVSSHWSQEPAGSFAAETSGPEKRFGC